MALCLVVGCGGGSSSDLDGGTDIGVDAGEPLFAREAYVKASNTAADAGFGRVVALNGGRLAVSAAGGVHPFARKTTGWVVEPPLPAAAGSESGAALAIDGDVLLVGAPATQSNTGAVHLFERLLGWSEITAQPQFPGGVADARFGSSVASALDWIVIGAPNEANNTGGAYVFRRSPKNGSYELEQKLTPLHVPRGTSTMSPLPDVLERIRLTRFRA